MLMVTKSVIYDLRMARPSICNVCLKLELLNNQAWLGVRFRYIKSKVANSRKRTAMEMAKTEVSLEATSKEMVDLENIPVEEVFEKLKCTEEGLSSDEVQRRFKLFGYNKLEEKKENKILKFLGFMWNPLSWIMEAAAIMAIFLLHGWGIVFIGILALLIINSTINFIEENNAGNAAAALMARVVPKAKVLRDGKWSDEDASVLVPGDIISIKLGDIISADARLLQGDPLTIDQSALTVESLPVTKHTGDGVYSCSTCTEGEIEAVVLLLVSRLSLGGQLILQNSFYPDYSFK